MRYGRCFKTPYPVYSATCTEKNRRKAR